MVYFMVSQEITTIKLNRKTKERIEKLRVHKRESYDDIMQRVLGILNVCVRDPETARERLVGIERLRKKNRAEENKS